MLFDEFCQFDRFFDAGNMPRPVDQREAAPRDKFRRFSHYIRRCGAILITGHAQGLSPDPAGIGSQVSIANSRTGPRIPMSRSADQHVAPAGDLLLAGLAKMRRKPALEDIACDRLDAALLDRGNPLCPKLR